MVAGSNVVARADSCCSPVFFPSRRPEDRIVQSVREYCAQRDRRRPEQNVATVSQRYPATEKVLSNALEEIVGRCRFEQSTPSRHVGILRYCFNVL